MRAAIIIILPYANNAQLRVDVTTHGIVQY